MKLAASDARRLARKSRRLRAGGLWTQSRDAARRVTTAFVVRTVMIGATVAGCRGVVPSDAACLQDSDCAPGTFCGTGGFCTEKASLDSGTPTDAGLPADAGMDAGLGDAGPGDAGVQDAGPVAPNTSPGGPITYTRIPWGSNATSGVARFTLTGSGGAASGNNSVIAYDRAAGAGRVELGSGAVNSDGGFSFTLSADPDGGPFLAGIGQDGDQSALQAVHNVTWIATFDGKISGSTVPNPHLLQNNEDFVVNVPDAGPPLLLGNLAATSLYSTEPVSYSPVYSQDTQAITTTAAVVWLDRTPGTASVPAARTQPAAAYDSARGRLVVYGGCGPTQCTTPLNDTWEYDGQVWTEPATSGPPAVTAAAMTYDSALGVSVLFGGCASIGTPMTLACSTVLGDTWEWNGSTWSDALPANASTPSARQGYAMAYDPLHGLAVLFGGATTTESLADTWVWDGSSWQNVTPTTGSPPARNSANMVYDDARGTVVLFGGHGVSGPLQDTWEWNGSSWQQLSGSAPSVRSEVAMAYDAVRGVVVVFGGMDMNAVESDSWQLNAQGQWEQFDLAGASPGVLTQAAAVYDTQRAEVVVFGGTTAWPTPVAVDTAWTWDGAVWRNDSPGTLTPSARREATLSYDSANDVTVLFGGSPSSGTSSLNDTWLWNGASWSEPVPETSPPSRSEAAMATDVGGHTLLFGGAGGASGNVLNDTWSWNGTTWINETPESITSTNSPSARSEPAMTYDAATSQFVLFGGYDGSNYLSDLWTWSTGTGWSNVTPSMGPPPREAANLTYDSARQIVVLFGGDAGSTGMAPNDTWAWNGSDWQPVSGTPNLPTTVNPSSRRNAAIAYDSARGVSQVFGGYLLGSGPQGDVNDLWEWNGASWDEAESANATGPYIPPPMDSMSMAYDSGRERTVIFGGESMGSDVDATIEIPSDPARRGAEIATFSFAGAPSTASIQQITFTASAAGAGNSLVIPGGGATVSGATLAAWDAWSGAWKVLATNTAGATVAPLTYAAAAAEAERYLVVRPKTINFAVFPTDGRGNGAGPTQVELDYVELQVQYQQ